jgi:WD40 repeat protein
VAVHDAASGREVRWLRASSAAFSVAVSPDGRVVAAGTWLGAVDLWDAESGEKLDELKGQTALATALDFGPRGDLLVVSSRDGSTRLWDVGARQLLATVAQRKWGAERVRFMPDGRTIAVGYQDGEIEVVDLDYYFRFAAGHVDYQLGLRRAAGETFPRADAVQAWAKAILDKRGNVR